MKTKLTKILLKCSLNKTYEDFIVIQELITVVKSDKTTISRIKEAGDNTFIHMFYNNKFFSIMFTDSNCILFFLPNKPNITYIIENDSYNIQYKNIKISLRR